VYPKEPENPGFPSFGSDFVSDLGPFHRAEPTRTIA
jgi:hypothetical protein